MNILGYLVTMSNLQAMSGPGGPPITDISVKVDEVQTLASAIRSDAAFPLETFRYSGFNKVGNIGTYLSENLRKYLFNTAKVDPKEKGLILTVTFMDPKDMDESKGTKRVITLNHADPIPLESGEDLVSYSGFFDRRKKRQIDTKQLQKYLQFLKNRH